jgi:hypothetical protein
VKDIIKPALFSAIVLAVYCICTAAIILENLNLDGEWVYNQNKSEENPYNFPRYLPLKLKIRTATNELTIERTIAGKSEVAIDRVLMDGSTSESTFEGFKKKSIAKWSPDGKQLTIYSILFVKGHPIEDYTLREIIWLSRNKKTLYLNYQSKAPGNAFITGIFAFDKRR